MSGPNILLVGNGRPHHVGACFQRALRELDYPYRFVDEAPLTPEPPGAWIRRSAGRVPGVLSLARRVFVRAVMATVATFRPDVVLVVKGGFLTPRVLTAIRRSKAILVNYATDDPFNPRASTREIRASIPLYDVYVTTRRATMGDLVRAGGRQVTWIPFAYDPVLHFPELPRDAAEANDFRSDVAFIGGGDEERASVFAELAGRNHADLRLYGGFLWGYSRFRPCAPGFVFGGARPPALAGTPA